MARTVMQRTMVRALCWCFAMAALRLAPGAADAAAAAGGRQPRTAAQAGPPPPPPPPPADATKTRAKRWSTTLGGSTSFKNTTANNAVQECNTDSDCLEIQFTSCGSDSSDRKRRCLCADGKQPLNGDCTKKPRALRTSCESDVECLPNAICKNNATITNSRLKICMCKDGFTEEKDTCNFADLLTFNYAVLLIGVISWILNEHRV